jgi:hypothetical protein
VAITNLVGALSTILKADGPINSGGTVEVYDATTLAPTNTYTTSLLNVPNSWPVLLDSSGYADIWVGIDVNIVLKDSTGTVIRTKDNVNPTQPSGSSLTGTNNTWTGSNTFSGGVTVPNGSTITIGGTLAGDPNLTGIPGIDHGTPNTWKSSFSVFEYGEHGAVYSDGSTTAVIWNAYFDDATSLWKYSSNGTASLLAIGGSTGTVLFTAISGTAGTNIPWIQVYSTNNTTGITSYTRAATVTPIDEGSLGAVTYNPDLSRGNEYKIVLTASTLTFGTPTNPAEGAWYTWTLTGNGGTPFNISVPATLWKFPNGTHPTIISGTAPDLLSCVYRNGVYLCTYSKGYA